MQETERQRRRREELDRTFMGSGWMVAPWLVASIASATLPALSLWSDGDLTVEPFHTLALVAFAVIFVAMLVLTWRVIQLCRREPRMRRNGRWLIAFVGTLVLADILLTLLETWLLGMTLADGILTAIVAAGFLWLIGFVTTMILWYVEAGRDEEMA